MRAHRVGVHIGHFIDVRVKVRDRKKVQQLTAEDVNQMFEAFAPMEGVAAHLPSLPPHPIAVQREVGTPRPATHNMEYGGMQVAVGNVKLNDGVWDVLFSVVVNNMVRCLTPAPAPAPSAAPSAAPPPAPAPTVAPALRTAYDR